MNKTTEKCSQARYARTIKKSDNISAKIRQCAAPTRVQTDSHVKGTVLSMRRHGLQRTQKTD